jgi:hypothetical protein
VKRLAGRGTLASLVEVLRPAFVDAQRVLLDVIGDDELGA